MKKLVLLIASIFLLVACSKQISAPQDIEKEVAVGIPVTYQLVSENHMTFSQFAVANDGIYSTVTQSDGTGNIMYTDTNSHRRIYLSSDAAADHSTAESTSFLDSTLGGASTIVAGDKVYVIKRGKAGMISDYGEKGRSYFEQMDLNGTNHKKLFLDVSDNFISSSAVAFGGEQLVFFLYHFTKGNELTKSSEGQRQLVSMNVNTGEQQVLKSGENGSSEAIIGADDQYIILLSTTKLTAENVAEQKQIVRIIRYNPATQEEVILKENEGNIQLATSNKYIYYYDNKANKLFSQDILTGEEKLFCDNVIPQDENYDQKSIVGGVYDNHIFFSAFQTETGKSKKYSVNLQDATVQENLLYIKEDFVGIYAEVSNYFLVKTGVETTPFISVTKDGKSIETKRIEPKFSFIQKSDYWKNNGEYIDIVDDIKYR